MESNPSNPRGPKLYNELYVIYSLYSLVVWVGIMKLFIIYYLISR